MASALSRGRGLGEIVIDIKKNDIITFSDNTKVKVDDVGEVFGNNYAIVRDVDEQDKVCGKVHKTMEINYEDNSMKIVTVKYIAKRIVDGFKVGIAN